MRSGKDTRWQGFPWAYRVAMSVAGAAAELVTTAEGLRVTPGLEARTSLRTAAAQLRHEAFPSTDEPLELSVKQGLPAVWRL